MDRFWWRLPGPERFVSRAVQDLRDGRNVACLLPRHAPRGLAMAVRREAEEASLGFTWHTIDVRDLEGPDPASMLYDRLVANAPAERERDAYHLLRERDFQDKFIWLEGLDAVSWPAWRRFLNDYAAACPAVPEYERTLFLVPLEALPPDQLPNEDICLKHHRWDGQVSALDMTLYASNLLQDRGFPALERQVAIATVAGLAQWDPALAEILAAEPLDTLLHPEALLRRQAEERGWTGAPSWQAGSRARFEGDEVVHSAALAGAEGAKELRKRLWKAQVGVLMPFVEERRLDILAKVAPHLRVPFETPFGVIEDVHDLEINHICYQMRPVPAWAGSYTGRLAEALLTVRNRLAHLQPVGHEMLGSDNVVHWRRAVQEAPLRSFLVR